MWKRVFKELFKGCVPRISFGPFLNNLTQMRFWSPSDSNVFDITHDYRFLQQAEIEELNQTIADLDDYSFKYDTVFDNLEDDLWRIHGFITMPVTAGLRYLWSKYWQRVVSKCFSSTSSYLPFFWEAYQIILLWVNNARRCSLKKLFQRYWLYS